MDDRRFDSLTKSLAKGASRRQVLRGLLGLGGAAVVGATVLEDDTAAARRPPRTPRPVTCPGRQVPVDGQCICPSVAPHKCGPDCCTGSSDDPYPRPPDHTECCDNACCDGTCYGEELCCPTNSRSGELPPTHIVCDGPSGKICVEGQCCLGAPSCDSGFVCCQGEGGTVCIEGSTCPAPCVVNSECQQCELCEGGFCTSDCGDDEICCNANCLSSSEYFSCSAAGGGCCAMADACCDVDGCCSGACYGGDGGRDYCCDGVTEIYCTVVGGAPQCCPDPVNQKCCGDSAGCCTSSQCNEDANVCCDDGQFACGSGVDTCCDTNTQKCCDGVCIASTECCQSTDGNCPGACQPYCDCADPANDGYDCNGGLINGGGVCACGYCVVPLDGCPCGCAGDTECVRCAGNGECENYNQGGSCNGGDGICDGEWCVAPPVCTGLGDPCSVDGDCCSGLCQGSCVTCKTSGGSCTDTGNECCSGYECVANHCQTP